jgi:hypothetical protein
VNRLLGSQEPEGIVESHAGMMHKVSHPVNTYRIDCATTALLTG